MQNKITKEAVFYFINIFFVLSLSPLIVTISGCFSTSSLQGANTLKEGKSSTSTSGGALIAVTLDDENNIDEPNAANESEEAEDKQSESISKMPVVSMEHSYGVTDDFQLGAGFKGVMAGGFYAKYRIFSTALLSSAVGARANYTMITGWGSWLTSEMYFLRAYFSFTPTDWLEFYVNPTYLHMRIFSNNKYNRDEEGKKKRAMRNILKYYGSSFGLLFGEELFSDGFDRLFLEGTFLKEYETNRPTLTEVVIGTVTYTK